MSKNDQADLREIYPLLSACISMGAAGFATAGRETVRQAHRLRAQIGQSKNQTLPRLEEAASLLESAGSDALLLAVRLKALSDRLYIAQDNLLGREALGELAHLHARIIKDSSKACALLAAEGHGDPRVPLRQLH